MTLTTQGAVAAPIQIANPTEAPAFALTFPDGRPVPEFVAPAGVAELFSISRDSVYDAIRRGELYARKFTARQFRIKRADALAWFYANHEGDK